MKLYKFRPLGNYDDFKKIKQIIEEKKFWCSKLWDLNDPMEGVFHTIYNLDEIRRIFDLKNQYRICSFSGKEGFENQTLWGYYANGFRGVAIEIKVKRCVVKRIEYVTENEFKAYIVDAVKKDIEKVVKVIITRKLKYWEHENEYRFLIQSEVNKQEIGKVKKIYFGDPYHNLANKNDIEKNSESFKEYLCYKKKLWKICEDNKIKPELFLGSEFKGE